MNSRIALPVQDYYTAVELAGAPGLPGSDRRARDFLKTSCMGRKRQGSKAVEYSFTSLPAATQDALLAKAFTAATPNTEVAEPAAADAKEAPALPTYEDLNDDQMKVMTARVAFVRAIQRSSQVTSQQKSIDALVQAAKEGALTPYLAERAVLANDRKTDTRTLSVRTLKRWISAFNAHGERALAPKRRKADMNMPPWGPAFMKHYQRPQKPSMAAALEAMREQNAPPHPSIHQVHRWLKKLSPEVRERGRRSGEELKALQSFKRRKTDTLYPNSVWQSDGHAFDAEVLNPLTSRPFRPEITLIEDWCTRRIVGFALNVAESTMATLDALKHSLTNAGMFETLYVDNGPGFKNAIVQEVVDRLGGTMTFSRPGAPQGHGLIERAHQTALIRLAKQFPSYIGKDMDRKAAHQAHRQSRSDIAKGLKPRNIPTFQEFFDRLSEFIEKCNNQPHSGLERIRDLETGNLRHQTPMESWASFEVKGWSALTADRELVASLTRPQHVRITARGEVQINRGKYYLEELVPFHGQEIKVAWDYRDSTSVGAFTLEGECIGEAKLDGNATDAIPLTQQEQAKEKRKKGQFKLLAKKAKTLTGEDVEILVIKPATNDGDLQLQLAAGRAKAKQLAAAKPETFVIPEDPMARYRLWTKLEKRAKEGEMLSKREQEWLESFPATDDYRAIKRVMDASANGKTVSARRAM